MKSKKFFLKIGTLLCLIVLLYTGCQAPAEIPAVSPASTPVTDAPKETEILQESPSVAPPQTPIPTEKPVPTPTAAEMPSPTPLEEPIPATVCSLTIRCDKALPILQNTNPEKLEFLPTDGVILSLSEATFSVGETVFDVLKRELQAHKIPFEFTENPMFKSAYIDGICNLYEFDCGDQSGWLYRVNGKAPSVGCSQYSLKAGDKIEFIYTTSYGDLP